MGKTEIIAVRVSEPQREKLEGLAVKANRNISQVVCILIDRAELADLSPHGIRRKAQNDD